LNEATTETFPATISGRPEVIAKFTGELAAIANVAGLGAPHEEVPPANVQLIALTPLTRSANTVDVVALTGLKLRSIT